MNAGRGVEDESEVSDNDSESDVESALSTPRAIQADIVSSKAERFMREGHAEAAAGGSGSLMTTRSFDASST